MKIVEELRNSSVEELQDRKRTLSRELITQRNKFHESKVSEKPHLVKKMRKDYARLLTILKEKEAE